MQSTLRFACAGDTPDSYPADKFGNPGPAAHSGPAHHTGAASTFAASYSVSAAMRVSS